MKPTKSATTIDRMSVGDTAAFGAALTEAVAVAGAGAASGAASGELTL